MEKYAYAAEKLSAARRSLMLPHPRGEAESIAGAFQDCSHGLHNIRSEDLDDNARGWVATIRELMDTSGIQDASGRGTFVTKAERLTQDQKFELSRAIDELAYWFDRRHREER